MTVNISTIKTSSEGAWQGQNPLDYAFPLLILQTTLVLSITRFLSILLKPLRQPKVIAEILGGILLGPSGIGRNKKFLQLVFPSWSTPILESAATIGLLFFLFLVGLELDLTSIRRSGKKAFGIALAGISLPFVFGAAVSLLLRKGENKVGYVQYLMFMGVVFSITAFPVLARILAELKLLTTHVGQTAMAAAALNDVAAWILLALAVALSGNKGNKNGTLISVEVLISAVAFVGFMMLIVRPMMNWVAHQCALRHDACICMTLAGVLVSGFMTDMIGIHAIFGAFIFGLTIPKEGDFAGRLVKRIEDFVCSLLLPLYFASSGLKTDVGKIRGGEAWGLVVVVISAASVGKILGTFMVAMVCRMTMRESLALGVLMNTKGLVELILLNIGKEKKVLNDESFAILVLMAIVTSFITTPTVIAIYKPARGISGRTHRKLNDLSTTPDEELRILACLRGPESITSIITLIESTNRSPLKLFIMHLVELTDRSSSIIMVQRARKNGLPFITHFRRRLGWWHDQVGEAFQAYSQLGRISIRHITAISSLSTMDEDICQVADKKRVSLIILPFHKQWKGGSEERVENVGDEWRLVNQRVGKNAPCSVAVLVDRGLGGGGQTTMATRKVCVMFFGGGDDREALELGKRMAQHPAVNFTLFRFIKENEETGFSTSSLQKDQSSLATKNDKELDDDAIREFMSKMGGAIEYIEKIVSDITEEVLAIGRGGEFELIMVGKGRSPLDVMVDVANHQVESVELGPIGDLLAHPVHGIVSSVLVIRQYQIADASQASISMVNSTIDA